MNKVEVSYEKIYTDDTGKHTSDVFGKHDPVSISYKRLWGGVVDGFFTCTNSDILLLAVEGDIRIIIANEDSYNHYKFEQYYLSALDGKIIRIPSGLTYAIHNMNNDKSAFLIGADRSDLNFEYSSTRIFNWRKKTP